MFLADQLVLVSVTLIPRFSRSASNLQMTLRIKPKLERTIAASDQLPLQLRIVAAARLFPTKSSVYNAKTHTTFFTCICRRDSALCSCQSLASTANGETSTVAWEIWICISGCFRNKSDANGHFRDRPALWARLHTSQAKLWTIWTTTTQMKT